MMVPSIFNDNLFDNWMDFPFENEFFGKRDPMYSRNSQSMMNTDVRETDKGYELDVDLPGFEKDQINAKLENGYLTISAKNNVNNNEKDKDGKYIRRERYVGSVSRSFYVGDGLKQEDIKGKDENGIRKLAIPKKEKKVVEENKYISIEG